MNILFFLSPKQDLMYVYDDFTLRQTLEKWENNRYASIPVLNRKGEYVGTLTEGDILWGLKQQHGWTLKPPRMCPSRALPTSGLQGRDCHHQHGPADRSGHEPELCARGGRPGHLYRHRAAAGIIRYCYDKARTEARKAQSAPDACPKGSLAAGG